MTRAPDLAERKAQLVAQSDLQRMQALLAWHAARRIMSPPPPAARSAASRSVATTMIGIALPFVGAGRLRSVLRTLSIAAWAVGEFAALFGGVLFLLAGAWPLVLPGALVFALSLAAIPLPRD